MAEVIDPDIMEVIDGRLRLVGGRCGACGEIEFPRKQSCRDCGGVDIAKVGLADHGVLWSWTVQRFPPPSPPYFGAVDDFEPFGVGYVELPGEVIVEARLTESDSDRLRIGMPMELSGIDVVTETGELARTFAFAPAEQQGGLR
ncbi:OB-fold domain-containing protein [Mycolicibacterium sp. 050232]|uniref:Zn-ribbon domain-containing OB-fold protein n=1 Tax=Mycolicibacterium sp. 050232 TaxID=3113982 RepID=UPI002E286E7B|nr:OB-fold domain-containing protein [Mycolicibacterium sp. 050232]MED5812613.1 OB-fold domain-containing protein [Mycolicibacterium sp. 050232]